MSRFSEQDYKTPMHFGWTVQSQTDPKAMDFAILEEPFSLELVEEFDEITAFYGDMRPMVVDFLAFAEEADAIARLPQSLIDLYEGKRMAIFETGLRTIQTHTMAERRFGGFLSASSSFRDRLLYRLGINKIKQNALRGFLSHLYDNSFDYRLCYNLRNYSQHHSSPFYIIPLKGSGEDGDLKYTVELDLLRDRILSSGSKIQPRVRNELEHQPEKIPLVPLCQRFRREVTKIFAFAMYMERSRLLKALQYEQVVRRTFEDMPSEATPLLFHGKPQGDIGSGMNCKVTSFSFDELEIIKDILGQLADDLTLPETFSAHYNH